MGGIGGAIGGMMQADAARDAAEIQAQAADRAGQRAMTGYNYLTKGAGAAPMQSYINTGVNALGTQGRVQGTMLELLGLGGDPNAQPAQQAVQQRTPTHQTFTYTPNGQSVQSLLDSRNAAALSAQGAGLSPTQANIAQSYYTNQLRNAGYRGA